MKQHTLNKFTILLPDIPEDSFDHYFWLDDKGDYIGYEYYKDGDDSGTYACINIPPGNWQLYRLSEVPESLAVEMVEKERDPWGFNGWMNYDKEHSSALDFNFDTAHASLTSWVRTQGVSGDPYLLIKKVNQ